MRIMITGAAGFIGSTLAKNLYEKHELMLIDNMSYGYESNLDHLFSQLIIMDCNELHKLCLLKDIESPDVIIHLAGISSLPECQANPQLAYTNNVIGTLSILEFAKAHNVKKIIFASTSAVYENNNEEINTENLSVSPTLIYSNSKLSAEYLCKSFAHNYDMNIIICRFFNTYGPNQDFLRKNPPFTSYLIKSLLAEKEIATIYNLDEKVKRDYIYVDDLIYILKTMIMSDTKYKAEIFNITSGLSYSTIDIINILQYLSNNQFRYKEGEPKDFWYKYPELKNLKESVIKHEIFKSIKGCNEKIRQHFISYFYRFTPMENGLNQILNFQKKFNKND